MAATDAATTTEQPSDAAKESAAAAFALALGRCVG